jgi:hypothetical protein
MNLTEATTFTGSPSVALLVGGVGEIPSRTLAIVGSHPKGREGIPWDDPMVDILLMNEAPLKTEKYPRWDMAIQIHAEEVYANENNWVNSDYWGWLQQKHGKPIFMQTVDPRIPDAVQYPLEEILALTPYRYLRSSPAMALALGIYLGYPKIMLFGSELTSNTEYAYQATNYAFWIGFALGRGVDLELHCWQDEFYQDIYGYDGELQIPADYFLTRYEDHKQAYDKNVRTLERTLDKVNEAMLANEYEKVGFLSIEVENLQALVGENHACMTEAKRYHDKANEFISRQEYERTSAQAQEDGELLRTAKDHAGGKVEYVWNVWKITGRMDALSQLRVFLKEKNQAAYQCGVKYGTLRENLEYLSEFDRKLQAAGGVRALGKPGEYKMKGSL